MSASTALRSARAGVSPSARVPRCAVPAPMGFRSDDAAWERGRSWRSARRARDRASRAAHGASHHAASRSCRPYRPGPRGLAGGQSARDASPARSRDRHAGLARLAPHQGVRLARRRHWLEARVGRASSKSSLRISKRWSTSCRDKAALLGSGVEPRAVRRAGGRVQPRHHAPRTSIRCSRRWAAACRA